MSQAAEAPQVPLLKAFLIALIILAVVIGFITACTLLGLAPAYFIAFLFLLNWSAVGLEQDALRSVAVGSFAGLGLAWLLVWLSGALGEVTGPLVFLGLLLGVITLQVAGRATLLINHATMVILTVMTVAYVMAGANFAHVAACLALGVILFGGGATLVRAMLAKKAAPETVVAG